MDPLTLAMLAVLALFVFLTWRSSRKRRLAAELAKEQFVPGAEIMTNYGLFGAIKAVEGDVVELEVAPKTVLRIHRGSILKLVTQEDLDAPKSVEEAMARANAEAEAREKAEAAGTDEAGQKPIRRAAKKTGE